MSSKKKSTKSTKPQKSSTPAKNQLTQAQKIALSVAVLAALAVLLIGIVMAGSKDTAFTTAGSSEPSGSFQGTQATEFLPGDGATLDTAEATHYVTIEIADYGTVRLELYGKSAPISVANFVSLAESGYYNGLSFHRIIEGYMMQGGGGTAALSPILGEFSENGFQNNLLHKRGVISMARTSVNNSATSQFFIMHQDYPSLDGKYAAFGIVTEGIEVVDKVCETAQPGENGFIAENARPVITSITVTEA